MRWVVGTVLCNTIHTVHCKEIRSYTRGREEGITGGPMCKRRHAHISIQEFAYIYIYIETIRNLCSYRLISAKPIRNRSNLRRNLYSHSWRNRCSFSLASCIVHHRSLFLLCSFPSTVSGASSQMHNQPIVS